MYITSFCFPSLSPKCPRACRRLASVTWCCALWRKENKQTMPLFLLCHLKGSWLSLKAAACWPVRLTTLQVAHAKWGTGKRHRCFVSNTSFLDPFCTHTHILHWAPPPLTPPVCAHHLSGIAITLCQCCPSQFAKAQHAWSTETATHTLLIVTIVVSVEFALSFCCASSIGQNR